MLGYLENGLQIGLVGALVVALLILERRRPASAVQRGEWLNNGIVFALSITGRVALGPLIAISVTRVVNSAGGGLVDLTRWPLWL